MSERQPSLADPLASVDAVDEDDVPHEDEERPRLTRQMVESLEGPPSYRAESVWADEVAEQVAALWEGRPEATSFAQALIFAQTAPLSKRRR